MKIKFLIIGLLGLVSATTFAQKKELENAQTEYDNYLVSNSGPAALKSPILVAKATSSINNAKTAIDKAATNEKTTGLPQTSALKGAIYASLALRDTIATTSAPLVTTAEEAIKKAKELDTKGDNKKLIEGATRTMAQYHLNMGIRAYQNRKYDLAYKSFDNFRIIFPEDTTAIFYTGLSASNQGQTEPRYYAFAIANYNKLLTLKYSGNEKLYMDLSTIYLITKDTVNAYKVAGEGVAKYPSNSELRRREIEIALQSGKQSDVLDKIQKAISNDPKNKTLYYYEGLTYSQVADAADAKFDKAKDDAGRASIMSITFENYAKAAEFYKKAIEIDPNYFEANLNLGYVLQKPAIETYYSANKLPASKQKEYEAGLARADALFDIARPYLQKAVDLNPKSTDALNNLRNYYRGKSDPAHKAENKAKADELKKQMDALSSTAGSK
jgi:tetratricopeptide (TPR) repeat protein